MTTTLTIRKAEPADIETVEDLRAEATAWLASKGLDQWQPGAPRVPTRAGTVDAIERGACYLAYDQAGELVGTITVDDRADPEFWTPEERAEPALYVHRMIVPRRAAGHDVGGCLLDWAADLAAKSGRKWLRLDAWKSNTALHRYYVGQQFARIRTVGLPNRGSGGLFQRLATSTRHRASQPPAGD